MIRKISSLLGVIALLGAFTACSDDEKLPSAGEPLQLSAPEVQLVGLPADSIVIRWAAVEHASAYACSIDGGEELTTTGTTHAFYVEPSEQTTNHTVAVRALAGSSDYTDSEPGRLTVSVQALLCLDFEDADLGTEGYIWGKPLATEQDDFDWQGNPIRSNLYFGAIYEEGYAEVWSFYSDSGHTYDAWNGFVVSNHTDTETEGYTNDKSVYAGAGVEGSARFAVGYYGAWTSPAEHGIPAIRFDNPATLRSVAVAHTTYAYRYLAANYEAGAMPEFTVVATGYDEQQKQTGRATVTLAGEDLLEEGWCTMNLSDLTDVTRLEFTVECSDEMAPLYFCIDNLRYRLQ